MFIPAPPMRIFPKSYPFHESHVSCLSCHSANVSIAMAPKTGKT